MAPGDSVMRYTSTRRASGRRRAKEVSNDATLGGKEEMEPVVEVYVI